MNKIVASVLLLIGLALPGFAQVSPTQVLGDFIPTSTFQCFFTTYRYDTGAPATLAGTPAVKVYKDGDATSEVTTGLTLTADFDSITGSNLVAVDTSNAFYAAGHDYTISITAGTVNTVSVVGFKPCRFSVGRGVNLTYVNGGSTGATAGKLELDQVVVAPAAGDKDAFTITGHGNGVGLLVSGGADGGSGAQFRGGAASVSNSGGVGLYVFGGNASADNNAGDAARLVGGDGTAAKKAGRALWAFSGEGDLGGGGVNVVELGEADPTYYGNSAGLVVIGNGSGKAINALGQVYVAPTNTDDDALKLVPNGTGAAISAGGLSAFGGIPKNTAVAAFPFVMYSTSGSPLAGLTVTCTVSLDGGAFGACTNSPAAIASGAYKVNLAAADTNGSTGVLKFTATGARTVLIPFVTQQ